MGLYMAIYGPTNYKKNVFYDGKAQKLFMGRVLGQPSGLAGRWVGLAYVSGQADGLYRAGSIDTGLTSHFQKK